MPKPEKAIIEENPTRGEILKEEPAAQAVVDDESGEKEETKAENVAKVPDISAVLSAQIAQAAKDEKELKKLEEKEGAIFEENTDLLHGTGSDTGDSSNTVYIALGVLGIVALAAYLYTEHQGRTIQTGDDEQTSNVPDSAHSSSLGLLQ